MLKQDEIRFASSCWNKARDSERLFVLLERDPAAPAAIRAWAAERIRLGKNTADDLQIVEALDCARLMEASTAPPPGPRPRAEVCPGMGSGGTAPPCCDRAGEYNGYDSGPLLFVCPKHCACHD